MPYRDLAPVRMHPFARSTWFRGILLATLATSLTGALTPAHAQSVNEREATVAYLFNFAKFVEWPIEMLPTHAHITLCVLGDSSLGAELASAVQGREISGHKLDVANVKADSPLRACELLYVAGIDQKHTDQVLTGLSGMPVFTVGDADHFAERGGIANLIFQDGRMRFAINLSTAQRAHLTISSRLLALATIVKDDARSRE